eukprot:2364603-Pyramimonas_sp.AAC.1
MANHCATLGFGAASTCSVPTERKAACRGYLASRSHALQQTSAPWCGHEVRAGSSLPSLGYGGP